MGWKQIRADDEKGQRTTVAKHKTGLSSGGIQSQDLAAGTANNLAGHPITLSPLPGEKKTHIEQDFPGELRLKRKMDWEGDSESLEEILVSFPEGHQGAVANLDSKAKFGDSFKLSRKRRR